MNNKIKSTLLALMLTLSTEAISEPTKKTITLTEDNSLTLDGTVTSQSIARLQTKLLLKLTKRNSSKPFYLVIDSPGGSIIAGMSLIESLRGYKNVHTICLFCASMAHAIVQAVNGDRIATHTSIFMAHRARGSFQGQFNSGELEARLKMVSKIVTQMEKVNAKRIGVSLKTYRQKIINEWWEYGEDSVSNGHADYIATVKCDENLLKKKEKIQIMTLLGPQVIEKSKCPLIR